MNYIKEINAFYDHQEREPLSGAAVALWHALMHMNNKTRWKNTFTAPGSVLRNKAGLTESSFKRARTELEELKYIEVESRGRGRAPIYTMHSLIMEMEQDVVSLNPETDFQGRGEQFSKMQMPFTEEVKQADMHCFAGDRLEEKNAEGPIQVEQDSGEQLTESSDQAIAYSLPQQGNARLTFVLDQLVDQHMNQPSTHHSDQVPAPLIKQYINKTNTKQNSTNASAAAMRGVLADREMNELAGEPDAILFYEENFGLVSPFVAESLQDWTQELGEELVIEAMKRALERNVLSWAYVKSILKAWDRKGIRTVAQAEAEYVAFETERRRKNRRIGGSFAEREDIVPDWFSEYVAERQRVQGQRVEEQGTREEVEEKMQRIGGRYEVVDVQF